MNFSKNNRNQERPDHSTFDGHEDKVKHAIDHYKKYKILGPDEIATDIIKIMIYNRI